MAIEARGELTPNEEATTMENKVLVQRITPDMIILDLAKGLTRDDIANKYKYEDTRTGEVAPFERWMVDLMFKDPALKGRKTSKAGKLKVLPFDFAATVVPEEEATPTTPLIKSNIAHTYQANLPGTESSDVVLSSQFDGDDDSSEITID
jgi:hypothetical protein